MCPTISRHSTEEIGGVNSGGVFVTGMCKFGHVILGLGFGAGVILGEQALEHRILTKMVNSRSDSR